MARRRGWGVAVGVAGAAAWLAMAGLPWPVRAYATFLLVVLPALAVAQVALVEDAPGKLPRLPVYASSAATLWLLALLALAAAVASGLPLEWLGVKWVGTGPLLAWGGGVTAAALALAVAGRAIGLRESRLLVELLPRTRAEALAFVFLSLSAGVGEELVFRGFLIAALREASGSVGVAAGVSAVVFGLVHAYQRAGGAIRAGVLGVLLTTPVLATGSVLPSMLAHFAYDVVAGLWLARRLLRR